MQKLVFSRYSGKLGTATRHQGPKTGTVWSVRENPSKSPKRPALPDAVNREGAVSRHRPFVLLANHTPFRGAKRGFPDSPCTGPNLAFWGSGRVLSPPRRETRHNGPNRAHQAGMGGPGCWARKSRCRVLLGSGFMGSVGNSAILLPPARTGTWPAGNPPALWKSPSPTGWR